jgi:hypothetical protein
LYRKMLIEHNEIRGFTAKLTPMDKKPENQQPDMWLTDTKIFSPEQMIDCEKCKRKNAPNRLKCMYCGDELPINEEQKASIIPRLRLMEIWEKGFNIIALPSADGNCLFPEIASQLRLETSMLEQILQSGKKLPLARAESLSEAQIIVENLKENGISSVIVSDEDLNPKTSPRRLRGIEFLETKLVLHLFNSPESVEIPRSELAAVVTGGLYTRKIEATEKHNKKDENKLLKSTETSSDESLIDIYSKNDPVGFRIFTSGFDFSCLGESKKLIANENVKTLSQWFQQYNPNAHFVDDYGKVRPMIGEIWSVEETKHSLGLKQKTFGSFNIENVTTINNLEQFTKYSRLQWQLIAT